MPKPLLDAAGRPRSPATLPGHHAGRPPRNKGARYPADPPGVQEIVAVMRQAADAADGARMRALIVVLWRAGLRIQEALALTEADLDARRGALLVRHGKGGKRREVGMDAWGWDHLERCLVPRVALPVGPLFCVLDGPTPGRAWSSCAARTQLRRLAAEAGVRRRFAPHQLRHAHAVELAHEGVPRHRPHSARADDARQRGTRAPEAEPLILGSGGQLLIQPGRRSLPSLVEVAFRAGSNAPAIGCRANQ